MTLSACDKDKKATDDIQTTSKTDSTEVSNILKAYTESINNADSVLGSKLFSHANEVSFIHPRGHEKGWIQIERSIYKFFGDTFSTRDLKASDIKISVYDNTAWLEFYWTFDATFKVDNAPIQTMGRETQILRKTDGQWKIVHVHYSGMPVTGERQGF
jgi:ketosteroid isomerase-like protein